MIKVNSRARLTFIKSILVCSLLVSINSVVFAQSSCGTAGNWLQVLGSGGPELAGRASTSYLIWQSGKARLLIDMGAGSFLRFKEAGAAVNDLDAILFTHFHVDHSGDLPALVKASYFSNRDRNLLIYGPAGNPLMPSATEYIQKLFAVNGAYRYLKDYLEGTESYQLIPHNVDASGKEIQVFDLNDSMKLSATPVHHGPVAALAWRIDLDGSSVAISGDMNNDNHTFSKLAADTTLLVAHHAIPEDANRAARNLHMPPSVIGQIARQAKVKQLVLTHRMLRTIGHEKESLMYIRKNYSGPVKFADDLQCFKLD
jgi:ribonuclease BN (tRNA processing enzyme)